MTTQDITNFRLVKQGIQHSSFKTPAEAVATLGAMQAQDYPGALWSVGLRVPGATLADVEQAIMNRQIVRTWPMRGTLHFVSPQDIGWMLPLLTPRVLAGTAGRQRNLGLNEAIFERSRELVTQALAGGNILTRNQLCQVLEIGQIGTAGQRGIHILSHLSQEGLLCFGPHKGKEPTFVLLKEWVPNVKNLDHDHALSELAKRYFNSHGPATLQDFVWWSGLKVSDARAGLDSVASELVSDTVDNITYWMSRDLPDRNQISPDAYLLPGFDEYMLGYKDRGAALDIEHKQKIVPGSNGMFKATIVIDGKIRGTWARSVKKSSVAITLSPFDKLNKAEREAIDIAAERYGQFIGLPVRVT